MRLRIYSRSTKAYDGTDSKVETLHLLQLCQSRRSQQVQRRSLFVYGDQSQLPNEVVGARNEKNKNSFLQRRLATTLWNLNRVIFPTHFPTENQVPIHCIGYWDAFFTRPGRSGDTFLAVALMKGGGGGGGGAQERGRETLDDCSVHKTSILL